MPHILLEYSPSIVENVDFKNLFRQMHQSLAEVPGFKLEDLKSRVLASTEHYVADGDPKNVFVHVELALFSGKDLSACQEAGERIMRLLKETFADSLEGRNCALSVEVRPMNRETYLKITGDQAHSSGA